MWPIQLNLRHLISILMFSWLVSFQSFSLEIVLTNHVSHPYNGIHFTHELNILIPVLLQMWVDCHIFRNLDKAPPAFCLLLPM
jgi:hypothetical protein